ncbi:hypothetical protein PtA15_8A702 [Puccinia triticina]|uniref:mannosyl-oligosaccharide 1,2-alpha-mannosidase n=1 Tax=Puccinia triticina TaxID=208348 RepID=A0ABY7CSX4_9BASI|nr:uncharacterized protein PtA15_8A702 [Puccinia triticina]WAQ87795.1 hypothetical protein PtA15_8A702 [Puccinia triticina]
MILTKLRQKRSATLVDSLDTLFIMGLRDEFDKGVLNTLKIDFSRSQTNDSAYELSGSKNVALLKQARALGDKLLIAWPDHRQNLPFPQLDFRRSKPSFKKKASDVEVVIAEPVHFLKAGTLILEFERLSYYTQDPKYLRQAIKAMQAIMNTPSTFPGLAGFFLAVQNQEVKNDLATWGVFPLPKEESVVCSLISVVLLYKRTATGLGPETFNFLGPNGEKPPQKPSLKDLEFFKKNGFYIGFKSYELRPEVVESAFYAWRLTGDTRYQDFVWDAFKSLQKHCKAPASFSAISDVNSLPANATNSSESFLYAELFKYIYLTFADPKLLSLDEYLFS